MLESFVSFVSLVYTKSASMLFALFSYFAPVEFVFVLIGLAIFTDTYAGRWCAKKLAIRNNKDVRIEVSSKKTREGLLIKMITYNLAIMTVYTLDKNVLNPLVMYFFESFPIDYIITKGVGIVFIAIEADSIDEKYYKVTGKRIGTLIREKVSYIKDMIREIFQFKKSLKDD